MPKRGSPEATGNIHIRFELNAALQGGVFISASDFGGDRSTSTAKRLTTLSSSWVLDRRVETALGIRRNFPIGIDDWLQVDDHKRFMPRDRAEPATCGKGSGLCLSPATEMNPDRLLT